MAEAVAMWEAQNKSCAICFLPIESPETVVKNKKNAPQIDHCHTTLKIRGILCTACNLGIGLLSDSVETLKSAISYLECHK